MDYEKIIAFRNTNNPYTQRQGVMVVEIRQGYARVVKTVAPDDVNPLGIPHGGVYFTMADSACGSAMAAYGTMAVTVDASWHFLRSAKVGDTLTAEAHEVKSGKTLCVMDVRILNQEDALLGTGTFTFYRLDKPLPI